MTCKICSNSENNKTYFVKEMMFGFRDIFEYIECGHCGCLHIADIPQDLAKYYPESYYSLEAHETKTSLPNFLERFFRKRRAMYALHGKDIIGRMIAHRIPPRAIYKWLRQYGVDFTSKILDVGAGGGTLVISLMKDGFKNITGIDPFISQTVYFEGRPIVLKSNLRKIRENDFDFVMMHHSLEHMPDQHEVFKEINRLLKGGRTALIRIPTVSSANWERFRENWANLDAPRHLYLHSLASIELLAKNNNFIIEDIAFDSNDFGFWASIQYERDIPLHDPRSYLHNSNASLFSWDDIKKFKQEAKQLNTEGRGDQICVILKKSKIK